MEIVMTLQGVLRKKKSVYYYKIMTTGLKILRFFASDMPINASKHLLLQKRNIYLSLKSRKGYVT